MNVTIFKNFNEVIGQMSISAVLDEIRNGRYRTEVNNLRQLIADGNKKEYDNRKKSLPAFTPSACFDGGRKQQYFVAYSGLIILDIDKLSHEQLANAFDQVVNIPYTYACFRSPSNNGLKILVRTDSNHLTHYQAYNEIKSYYEQVLGLEVDSSGKDITRLCFFSWDPDTCLKEKSEIFKTTINMIETDILKVVEQIESKNLDITNGYKDWLNIGFALADALGEAGRIYYHRISRFNAQYNSPECDKQYDSCLKSHRSGVTAKSLFYLAKDHGIDISPVKSYTFENKAGQGSEGDKPGKQKEKTRSNLFNKIEKFLQQFYNLRYNVVTGRLEIKLKSAKNFEPMTDYMENSIFRQLHKNNIFVSMAKLRSILQSDFCERYDPFIEYYSSLPVWDAKTDYIQQLADTITAAEQELWSFCFKKWIVAVVASLLDPSVVNHTAIIFSGAQGLGKTTWMEKLCPFELRPYLFSGTINPNNKDTLVQLSECMLINMDELENMNRTEIGTLKEIITKSAIRIRRSYGHNNENLLRRASFMGSVNTSQFLNDTTGSRRFLCFEVTDIDYKHCIDINNVYAQAMHLWKSGFRFYFDKHESGMITESNEKYQIRTAEEELLLAWFVPVELNVANTFLSASQIMAKLSGRGCINTSTGGLISLGKALKKHGFTKTKRGGLYVWAVKELDQIEVESNMQARPATTPF
jgi:predicted P-loop ATPase